MAFALRPATSSDSFFIEQLCAAAFSEYTTAAGAKTLALVTSRGATTWLAWRNGKRIGLASVDFGPPAHLLAIAVAEPYRGCGFGQRLLASVEAIARKRAVPHLELMTADSNLAALQLFLRAGFQIQRRVPRYYARGQTGVLLTKTLLRAD